MKKNVMIQGFINALIEDKFVVIPDILIADFKEAARQVKIGKDEKPLFFSGGAYFNPQESEVYPLGGQGFYID